jgi:hypothetical protein
MKKTIKYLLVGSVSLIMSVVVMVSCDDDEPLPKIDGYNNSDEVAAENLLANWKFDGNNKEDISGTAASNTYGTVGFETGRIGQALKLTKGVLVYPTIANINTANALNNFSVSLWVNVLGSKKTAEPAFTSFFGLIPTGVTDIWPDIMAGAETARNRPTSDTLQLKNILNTHPVGGGNSLQDNVAQGTGSNAADWFLRTPGNWVHYVLTWDAATHMFLIYGDTKSVGSFSLRGTTGNMIMAVPVQAVFGSLASSTIGFAGAPAQQAWNPYATASIDDVRVYNTVLDQTQVTALFNLGTAGR